MFRQAAKKAVSLTSIARPSGVRYNCNDSTGKKPDPLCAHHKDLVPPFNDICKLKTFDLKSDCASFHLKTVGQDQNSKPKGPCDDLAMKN